MFYNIFNEEVSQESILNDLISYYQDLHDENKTAITDFSEGSEVRTLLEVLSHLAYNILEEQNETLANHFINTAEGEYLDLLGTNPNVNLPREEGNTASGLVKFTLSEPATEEKIIPADTMVNSNEQEYTTLEDGIINIGETYTYVEAECVIEGEDGNCAIGAINNCSDYPEFTVTNDEAFINGTDYEEDEAYRTRLLEFIRIDNFGSRGYYENIMLNTKYVHDIKIDDSAGDIYNIAYYINTNSKVNNIKARNELVNYFGDNNNLLIGHKAIFYDSTTYRLSFEVHVPSDCPVTESEITEFIYSLFTGSEPSTIPTGFKGLNMGETISKNELIDKIKDFYSEITDVTIDNIVISGIPKEEIEFPDNDPYNAFELYSVGVFLDG